MLTTGEYFVVLFWKVKTVDKVEHNHPELILQIPERLTAFIEFTVCRDDSTWLGEEAQGTPRRPSYRGREDGRYSEAERGGFLKAWGFNSRRQQS